MLKLLLLVVAAVSAKPVAEPKAYASNFGYTYNPLANLRGLNPFTATPAQQYQAQDELGQYNYGYSNDLSSKQETKDANGVVRGSYSYLDANGNIQNVDYISDIFGFRTSHSLAQPVSSVPYHQGGLRALPVQSVAYSRPTPALTPTVAYTHLPYATSFDYYYNPTQQATFAPVPAPIEEPVFTAPTVVEAKVAPGVAAPAHPVVAEPTPLSAPVVPVVSGITQSQYHAQDELGQYQFGYTDPNSARTEIKTADGAVRGAYNYVDDQGKIQTVEYVADDLGFRVIGTNIPVQNYAVPQPVAETPEVQAARLEHAKLVAEVRARNLELRPLEEQVVEEVVAAPVVVAKAAQVPVAAAVAAAAPVQSQFHAQDELGQYNYGYSNQDSSKVEQRLADGSVRGAYSYVDANGEIQTVSYISDVLGFRVAGTNIPAHHVEPVAAPVATPVATPVAKQPTVVTPTVAYSYLPYATNYGYNQPAGVNALPAGLTEVVPAPQPIQPQQQVSGVVSSQFHAQDEAGQYNYGYSNPQSAKQETKSVDGVVRGSYSYVDANGLVQTVNYISDALGFRAVGTNIPRAQDSVMEASVSYSHLPYAVNHPYYY